MGIRLFDLVTCKCSIDSSEFVHEAMLDYIAPYKVSTLNSADTILEIGFNVNPLTEVQLPMRSTKQIETRMSHFEQSYHVWTTEDRQILIPERLPNHVIFTSANRILISAEQPAIGATIGTRVVRQLIMRSGEALGGRCVHAGVVDINGKGILIGGYPGAGKTSVLTHLIEHYGAQPICNDRTVLVPMNSHSWRGVGVPLSWRFTPEGICGSQKLRKALTEHQLRRGGDMVDGKVELTPQEVSQFLDSPTLCTTQITRIVILVRSSNKPSSLLDNAFIEQHLGFGAADPFSEDWLNIRPQFIGSHSEHLDTNQALWDSLTAIVPIQILSWVNPDELPGLASAVVGYL